MVSRILYYKGDKLISTILLDDEKHTVSVENASGVPNVILPFGVRLNPTWEDLDEFLQERCIPRTRANIKEFLDCVGVDWYDPLEICRRTEGRLCNDDCWMKIEEVVV